MSLFSTSLSNTPKRVIKPVSTENQRSPVNTYAGNLLHRLNARLVSIRVHRTLMICCKNKLKEIHRIKQILSNNGYPKDIISKHISDKISQFSKPKVFGPDKFTVYLRSAFNGLASLFLERKCKNCGRKLL